MDIARNWVDVLATGDYETVAAELGYLLAYDDPPATCIRRQIESYRSPDYYPGVDTFTVTSWRTANGGNPAPRHQVTWFDSNDTRLVGAVAFDLPLNGKWSDLTADSFTLITKILRRVTSFVWKRSGQWHKCIVSSHDLDDAA